MNDDIWAQLKEAGFVEGEPPGGSNVSTPWYVRTMLGIAGWIGAMFLLGAVGSGFALVMESAFAALFIGGLLCLLAVFLFWRASGGSFADQFAFALSLAGQALIVVGLSTGLPEQIETIALLLAIVEGNRLAPYQRAVYMLAHLGYGCRGWGALLPLPRKLADRWD